LSGRSARRTSLIVSGLAAAVLGVIYPYATDAMQVVVVGFLLVFCIGVLIGIGWALYVPELFPTELRMRGAGTCNTAGRLVSIITPYGVIALFGLWGVSGVVFTLSGILVVMVAMVAFWGVETSRRTLEELRPDDLGIAGSAALADGAAE
jgi:putative MFS transporter